MRRRRPARATPPTARRPRGKSPARPAAALGVWLAAALALSQAHCVSLRQGGSAIGVRASLESRIWREVNLARARPDLYASYLEGWLSGFEGTSLHRPGRRLYLLHEGRPAVEEALRFLRRARPLPPLALSDGMSRGASDLIEDLGPAGGLSHVGLDGSEVGERLNRYGLWRRKAAEVIQCGTADPREIVALLIVDDGVTDRGHRRIVFDPEYRVMGAAIGWNARYQHMCVITVAADYLETLGAVEGNAGDRPAAGETAF